MLGDVEHDAVGIPELLFRVDTGIARQLHEEFAALRLDLLRRRLLILDDEADVMQPRPVWSALATLRSLREVRQREVHDAVGKRDRIADRALDLADALEVEDPFVEHRGLLEIGDLDGDMPDLAHGDLHMWPVRRRRQRHAVRSAMTV